MKKLIIVSILFFSIIYSDELRIDGSTSKSFEKSLSELTKGLDKKESASFMEAYMKILKKENLGGFKNAEEAREKSLEVMRKKLNGKTFSDILQMATGIPLDDQMKKALKDLSTHGTSLEYQNDADKIRLEHLEYWTKIIEEYYKKSKRYPFQDKIEKGGVGLVRVLSNAQREYIDPNSSKYREDLDNNTNKQFNEFNMKEFINEIENILGRSIDEKYDVQSVPSKSPIGYNYFVTDEGYLFWITCLTCGVTKISTLLMDGFTPTVNIASRKMKKNVTKALERDEMIKHKIYKKWKKKKFYKEEYVRDIEKQNLKDSKKQN